MRTTIPITRPEKPLLICGIVSSLLYVAMNIAVPMQWPGYSSASRVVSELSAIGAPTRPLWVALAIVYDLLLIAFAWGVWRASRGSRPLRIVATLLFIIGVISFAWPPMHVREVLAAGGATVSDTLHIAFTMLWALAVMLAMGFAAAAFGSRFRVYSIATMVILVAFGALTGVDSPKLSTNLPTPWIGVWERINIGAYVAWVIVFAVALLRKRPPGTQSLRERAGFTQEATLSKAATPIASFR